MGGKRYIIEGRHAETVIRENRIRISRGDLIVTPCDEVAGHSADEIPEVPQFDEKTPKGDADLPEVPQFDEKTPKGDADSKDIQVADDKKPAKAKTAKSGSGAK